MAAIIDLRTGTTLTDPGDLHTPPHSVRRPQLRLVHGGRSARGRHLRRQFLVRRALVLVGLVVALFLLVQVGGLVAQAFSAPTPSTAGAGATRSYVVQPGDTLWAVAAEVAPSADPVVVVDRIVELNSVDGAALRSDSALLAGQRLVVPSDAG